MVLVVAAVVMVEVESEYTFALFFLVKLGWGMCFFFLFVFYINFRIKSFQELGVCYLDQKAFVFVLEPLAAATVLSALPPSPVSPFL